jgi:hypothetical protein
MLGKCSTTKPYSRPSPRCNMKVYFAVLISSKIAQVKFFGFLEPGSHCIAQANLELTIFLPFDAEHSKCYELHSLPLFF